MRIQTWDGSFWFPPTKKKCPKDVSSTCFYVGWKLIYISYGQNFIEKEPEKHWHINYVLNLLPPKSCSWGKQDNFQFVVTISRTIVIFFNLDFSTFRDHNFGFSLLSISVFCCHSWFFVSIWWKTGILIFAKKMPLAIAFWVNYWRSPLSIEGFHDNP